jgi:hypothetical protein
MTNIPRFPRRARNLVLLGICLLILGAVPTNPARAALLPQMVDNSLQDFTRGTFQRSSLSALRNTTASPDDQTGAVQLVPVGILKDWFSSPFLLPKRETDVGAVAIGPHIFVIGGTATVGAAPAPIADVWSVTIDPTTGAPIGNSWYDETDLPAVQTNNRYPATTAGRAVPAVAAVSTTQDDGYIYVIGGNVRPTGSPDSVSSYAVSIGTVVGGHITGWSVDNPLLRLPSVGVFGQNGLQSASALSFTTGGQTYIYVIGGLQRYREGAGGAQHTAEAGSSGVLYTKVGAGGQLLSPSNSSTTVWDLLTDPIPLPTGLGDGVGIWDGAAVADHFDVGGGVGGDVLYIMGGQLRSSLDSTGGAAVYNNEVFRALINTNGTLAWQTDNPPLTLPEARVGHAAVEFNGNIYVTGGRPVGGTPGQPQPAVLTSYVEDNLKLATIGENSNFIRNSNVLTLPRARHGSVVVAATPTEDAPNAAYVYVIAGQGDATLPPSEDDQGSDTMIYGKIGKSEDVQLTGYAASGWYYSAPYNTIWDGAQVQEVRWTTTITPPSMDIKMQYRISTASDCDAANTFTSSPWRDLDGSPTDSFFSKNGANAVGLAAGLVAHCFQYRAFLTSGGSPPKQSPALLNVSILVFVPGSPDLKVKTINDLRSLSGNNALTGLTATLTNQNTFQQTLPADAETKGSFFVDLFVFYQGEPYIAPSVPLTNADKARSKGYANVNKSAMTAGADYTVLQWCNPSPLVRGCQAIDLLSTTFSRSGTYTVTAVVDSFNYVPEAPAVAEQNNVTTKVIVVPSTAHNLYMPLIHK